MSGGRRPDGRWGWRADPHLAAAACLGACLLAGTALSGALSAGPSFPAVGGARATAQPVGADAGASRGAPPAAQTLDINRAGATDLQALPGIGPALARRIVSDREAHGPFGRPADLLRVSGVGAKRYARLQGLIHAAEAP